MRWFLIVSMAMGFTGCGASGEGESEPQGAAAAPGVAAVGAPGFDENLVPGSAALPVEGSADPSEAGSAAIPGPSGVVLDDGRVVSEEVAGSGLVPKAANWTAFRKVHGSTTGTSSMTASPSSTHVCVLAMIWGTLYGNNVTLSKGTTDWKLYTTLNTVRSGGKVAMDAVCYPLSSFVANGAERWMSDSFNLYIGGTGSQSVLTWWGDAATYLSSVGGIFYGSGEQAWVTQSNVTDLSSTLSLKTLQAHGHSTAAYSFFVGIPGTGHVPQFIGPNGTGSAATAGEYRVDFDGENQFNAGNIKMAHSDEAMCYFTSITGKWSGSGEWVQIVVDSSGYWRLKAQAVGNNQVHARARCYRLRQTAGQ
jgi:hypothetical protein